MQNESINGPAIQDCEKEPITIPGSVQAHGLLIAIRLSDFTILQISENVFDLIGTHSSELLHQPLSKLMALEPIENACRRLGERQPRLLTPIPLELKINGTSKHFDGILHRSGRLLILELEKHIAVENINRGFGGFYEAIRETSTQIMVADNLTEVFDLACEEVRKITGFSRVLVYKFDEEWNGTVIAESRQPSVKSLMNHRFPASDIPKQARQLYTTNWLRLIPDVNYQPSRLVPTNNPITDAPLDLSHSVLRSVSPVHLEYMRNMGQGASMSISLLKNKQLWGLISCHHPSAHFLKYDIRIACEFIGQIVSTHITGREESATVDYKLQLKGIYEDLLSRGGTFEDLIGCFRSSSFRLLALADAQGAALIIDGVCVSIGTTPSKENILKLSEWFLRTGDHLFATDSLSKVLPNAETIQSIASGLLAISIPRDVGISIMWFRPEMKDAVLWGGNPHESKIPVASEGRYSPRKSFETWMENVSGRSRKWKQTELDVVEEFRNTILNLALKNESSILSASQADFRTSLADAIARGETTSRERDRAATLKENMMSLQHASAGVSRSFFDEFVDFALVSLNSKGLVETWSAGAQRLMGYEPSTAMGSSLALFFGDEDVLGERHELILKMAQEQGRCEEELWLYRGDKTSFWGKILVTAGTNEKQKKSGFSILIQDVTKEKANEEELKATKAAAEMANQTKTAFLANISHEIRTPLGAILGFAELMKGREQNMDERDLLFEKVKRNGEQLTVLINDLLDMTKVEAGRLEIEELEFELENFLRDIRQSIEIKAAEKGSQFQVVVHSLPGKIVSDPTRIRQIILNLSSNAIKFTESGGRIILDCSLQNSPEGTLLAIRMTDSGCGMSESEMGRLFKPFSQADVSTTRKYGGSGLGLFVSQRLARAMRGDLMIERSKLGAGTTFLALVHPKAIDQTTQFSKVSESPPKQIQAAPPDLDLNQKRILLVDDSIDNRDLISVFLKMAGAHVECETNGQTWFKRAIDENFDVVLMDIQMPIMDGNKAMENLRERDYKKPVIALTAHAMNDERERSLALGFSAYLTKPVDRILLIQTIAKLTEIGFMDKSGRT